MSFRFWNKSASSVIAGLYLHPNFVMMAQHQGDEIWVQEHGVSGPDQWAEAVTSLLKLAPQSDVKLHVVLASNYAQIIPIDKPLVADDELAAAIPWAVKDLVAEPISDLVTDYFYCGSPPNAPERVNVVCCRRQWIELVVSMAQKLGLDIAYITSESVVLANLVTATAGCQLLLWQVPGSELELQIIQQNVVKFSRQLRGFSQVVLLSDVVSNSALLDDLSLELQRSIDYVSGTLKLPDVSQMQLLIASSEGDAMAKLIGQNLAITVSSSIGDGSLKGEQLRFAPVVAGLLEVAS